MTMRRRENERAGDRTGFGGYCKVQNGIWDEMPSSILHTPNRGCINHTRI
jgi:hypothetical protein